MRAQTKQVRQEEEEESVFVSMTDMTIGFLFIMMLLLAFFARQIDDTETIPKTEHDKVITERDKVIVERDTALLKITQLEKFIQELQGLITQKDQEQEIERLRTEIKKLKIASPLEIYLAKSAQTRKEILMRLRDAIVADFPELQVELSEQNNALRFQGEGLFASGQSLLLGEKRNIVARLAQRMDEILPCFTLGRSTKFAPECNPNFAVIEAVQIEGHTDNIGPDSVNRRLSADRANSTFQAMTESAESIQTHLNLRGQPVLSVSAYGPDRPVTTNVTAEGRATNRRIDLRFIMVTPQDSRGLTDIRNALQAEQHDFIWR